MYEVFIERSVERQMRRLPSRQFERITRALASLGADPRPPGARKIIGSANDWRVRVGDYRVIYEVDDEARAVRVMRVRHRRDVYR